jgi:DNA-binding NarL/FixJ family response regulator
MGYDMIRVAIADDHHLFAEGIRDALSRVPDLRVVGVAGDAQELTAMLADQPADVLMVDLEMPEGGGEAVLASNPTAPVIVVSMYITPEVRARLLGAGASGVLSKSTRLTDLAAAIRAAYSGYRLDGEEEEDRAILDDHQRPQLDPGAASLTERERELLGYLARGVSSTEELAEQLFISQKTVKNHLASIFQKLSVADRTQAAVEAIRLGMGP